MQLSDRARRRAIAATIAVAVAAPCEGIRQLAYYDPPGILTVCEGHTGKDVIKNHVYSLKECGQFMTADMAKAVAIVDTCVPDLPPTVLAAFSDAVFNMGPTIACDREHSTAARLLGLRRLREACEQLLRWDKAKIAGVLVSLPGLSKRRRIERDLCIKELV